MSDSQSQMVRKPALVKLGLFGVKTRRSALTYMWVCVAFTVAALVFQRWVASVGLLVAALWYLYSIRWVDKNNQWG